MSSPTFENSSLAVYAGGNNDRIGNLLPLYGRLLRLSKAKNRTLFFPFAEVAISKIFERLDGHSFVEEARARALNEILGRIIHLGEESIENSEGVPRGQYSENVLHCIDFHEIGVRALFSRGDVDLSAPASLAAFDTHKPVVWKDPFPLTSLGSTEDAIESLVSYLCIRKDLLTEVKQMRLSQFSGAFALQVPPVDVCLHIRQGDFRRWRNGEFYYTPELIEAIISTLQVAYANVDRDVRVTLLSDEPLPDSLMQAGFVESFSSHFAADFIRISMCDLVLSNGSTFSRSAAFTGRSFLGSSSRYISLGEASGALGNAKALVVGRSSN